MDVVGGVGDYFFDLTSFFLSRVEILEKNPWFFGRFEGAKKTF